MLLYNKVWKVKGLKQNNKNTQKRRKATQNEWFFVVFGQKLKIFSTFFKKNAKNALFSFQKSVYIIGSFLVLKNFHNFTTEKGLKN